MAGLVPVISVFGTGLLEKIADAVAAFEGRLGPLSKWFRLNTGRSDSTDVGLEPDLQNRREAGAEGGEDPGQWADHRRHFGEIAYRLIAAAKMRVTW